MVSGQFNFVHVVAKMLPSVEDRGELMEGGAVGKLDPVEEHLLGADTTGATNESAVMEGGEVFDRVRGVDRVEYVYDRFADLGGDIEGWWSRGVRIGISSGWFLHGDQMNCGYEFNEDGQKEGGK